mgnify:CR=1 FL=1
MIDFLIKIVVTPLAQTHYVMTEMMVSLVFMLFANVSW